MTPLTIVQIVQPYYVRGWCANQTAGATGLTPWDVRKAFRSIGRQHPDIKARHDACKNRSECNNIWPNAKLVVTEAEREHEI